jgi:DNA-binding CsgD family transcriptional regulator
MNFDTIIETIVADFKAFLPNSNANTLNDFSQFDQLINDFSKNEHSLKIIIDLTKLKVLAVSDNLEALTGYTKTDYQTHNILMFFRSIKMEHTLAPLTIAQWAASVFKGMPSNTNFEAGRTHVCGLNVKAKNGQESRVLLRFMPVQLADNGFPSICIINFDFITHLLKPSGHWWGRISYGEDNPHKFHILSTDKKYNYQDIISEREKDVLKLVAEGMESKEIAQKLFISLNTVDNHRNAVLRTGARDTTALIQLCRMCGIL